jgi:hypothetical protein
MINTFRRLGLTWGLAWISRSPHLLAHPGTKRTYGLDRAPFNDYRYRTYYTQYVRHITASKEWAKEIKLYVTIVQCCGSGSVCFWASRIRISIR